MIRKEYKKQSAEQTPLDRSECLLMTSFRNNKPCNQVRKHSTVGARLYPSVTMHGVREGWMNWGGVQETLRKHGNEEREGERERGKESCGRRR